MRLAKIRDRVLWHVPLLRSPYYCEPPIIWWDTSGSRVIAWSQRMLRSEHGIYRPAMITVGLPPDAKPWLEQMLPGRYRVVNPRMDLMEPNRRRKRPRVEFMHEADLVLFMLHFRETMSDAVRPLTFPNRPVRTRSGIKVVR